MKARHRSMAEALGFVIDDLQASLLEAPDAEIVELARGCWQPGAEAGRVREVLLQALRAERKLAVLLTPLPPCGEGLGKGIDGAVGATSLPSPPPQGGRETPPRRKRPKR